MLATLSEKDATALIIGGGLVGLTAAIALERYGIDTLVFEQVEDLGESQVGAGLGLGYNVARAFRHLGLLDDLREVAAPIQRIQYTHEDGEAIGTMQVARAGELQQGVIRPVFHRFLADAAGEDRIRMGARFVRFEQDGDGVTARFADGREARGEVLIGADGLRSAVREQLLGAAEPRYAGYATRRGVLEHEFADQGTFRIMTGGGRRFFFYPVGGGHVYWTAVTNDPPGGREDPAEIRRTVLERFRGWAAPARELVERTDDSQLFLADIYDRDPVKRWGEGRVTLLGDAAHPMTFDMGQGAGQGIEGAVFLAQALAEGSDRPAALRAWESKRIKRTTRFVKNSRSTGAASQSDGRLQKFLHDRVIIKVMTSRFGTRMATRDLAVDYGPPVGPAAGYPAVPCLTGIAMLLSCSTPLT